MERMLIMDRRRNKNPEWSELGRKNVEAAEAQAAASDAKVAQAQA